VEAWQNQIRRQSARRQKNSAKNLKNADMSEFDRMMRHLINVPKEKIDHAEKKKLAAPRRGR